jgi:hypothetical protein
VQAQCSGLLGAMLGTPAAKERVRSIDCDPKQAADAAGRVFALNAGLALFQAKCAGGTKLPQNATTDELLGFGRQCLQDSGLTGKETETIGSRLQAIDMNRDDKAHRFVVTWNAFLDGNRLAYLALVLAIGVDALVFMAGLFGAAAVKSPLSDVPSPKARSAEQLEAVIDTALLPHLYENARLVLNAMQPMTARDGYAQRVVLDESDPQAVDVLRRVVNAGSTIGAVREVSPGVYELRSELFEHLSRVAKNAFKADRQHVVSAELERIVSVALLPDIAENAEIVLQYMHPVEARPKPVGKGDRRSARSFSAEIRLNEVAEQHKKIVRNALNAGATLDAVQRDNNNHYAVSSEFYKALAQIRARLLQSTAQRSPYIGGPLRETRAALSHDLRDQIEHRPGNGHGSSGPSYELDHDDFGRQVREDLLRALSLPSEAFEEREDISAVAEELKQQIEGRRNLSVLRDIKRDSESKLGEAVHKLREEYRGNDRALRLIDDARWQISQLAPALKLLREPILLDRLIREAEADGEVNLASRLRRLRDNIMPQAGRLN